MPKALQKPPPHPLLGPTEHRAIFPPCVQGVRKGLGSRRDSLVHGAFLNTCRRSGEGHGKGKAELMMGKKKEHGMTIAEFSSWPRSFILTVCKLWSSVPDHQQRLGIYYFRPRELEE